MADYRSKLATIVREQEARLVADWIGLLAKRDSRNAGDRAETEDHARTFVGLLADAVQGDGTGTIDGPEWAKVRDMLASLSASRASQGATPTETPAPAGREVRLVAVTGYGMPEDHRRSTDAGFDAHLVKPVDPARLAAVIAAPIAR